MHKVKSRSTNLAWQQKGYSQLEGINFGELFSPVAKLTSIRFILSIVVAFDLEVENMDAKTMFLHGDMEEEICMKLPKGFTVKGMKELVCKLKKLLSKEIYNDVVPKV